MGAWTPFEPSMLGPEEDSHLFVSSKIAHVMNALPGVSLKSVCCLQAPGMQIADGICCVMVQPQKMS